MKTELVAQLLRFETVDRLLSHIRRCNCGPLGRPVYVLDKEAHSPTVCPFGRVIHGGDPSQCDSFMVLYNKVKEHTILDRGKSREMWYYALKCASVPGDFAEFGVYRGGGCFLLGCLLQEFGISKTVWGFDSFQGLPEGSREEMPHAKPGEFQANLSEVRAICRGLRLNDLVRFVPGWFRDTLPKMQPHHRFSFCHIDCDLYESTADVLKFLHLRMSPGSILLFDDYGRPYMGQKLAANEWAQKHGFEVKTGFGHPHQAVVFLPNGY